jgi:hypothetical protein
MLGGGWEEAPLRRVLPALLFFPIGELRGHPERPDRPTSTTSLGSHAVFTHRRVEIPPAGRLPPLCQRFLSHPLSSWNSARVPARSHLCVPVRPCGGLDGAVAPFIATLDFEILIGASPGVPAAASSVPDRFANPSGVTGTHRISAGIWQT